MGRFFSKLKHFLHVAARYEKLGTTFRQLVLLTSMQLSLRAYEFMA
jgi:hypothetical protein